MNNQWGRSGNGSTTSRGGGLGGIVFASVVSLALGAAGGYCALRVLGGTVPTGEIESRDNRIAELARELDSRIGEIEAGSQKTRALAEENDTLKRQVEALQKSTDTSDASVALAENARLTQKVVPELKNELERSAQRTADAEALKKRAEEAVLDRERQLSLQVDQIARLEKALDQARSRQGAEQSAEAERLSAEADALRAQLETAQRAEKALRTKELPALRDEISRKAQEIASLKAENAALDARVAALETAARSTEPTKPDEGDSKPALDNAKPADAHNPRNAALVARALEDTPGLDRLTTGQRDQLERTLVSGECVTNALGGVFNRVPVLALRNLMRDLDSDC